MDRDFNFSFPVSGDSSTPPLCYFEPDTTFYSDTNLQTLLPFPSDFSFNPPISDPNILLSKIHKLEPSLLPSYTHHFAGNLPALRSLEPPTSFNSYFTKLEPLSPSYTPRPAGNLPALPSFESPAPFDSHFTKLQPLSPSYTHRFPSNLPALRSLESPASFDSYFAKLEPLSPSYIPAGNLPALQSFESPTPFDSYFTKSELLSSSYTHSFPSILPALQSFESPTSFDSYFTNLVSVGSNNHQPLQPAAVQDVNIRRNTSPPSSRGSKRKRSQRIGDKYRSFKKLIPLDKRMDTTTMLGEAYKYIKFLQAQVKALENMPAESGFKSENGALGSVFGAIGELSRNELLQVVLNSAEVQNMLYSEGSCVFSIEQLMRFN